MQLAKPSRRGHKWQYRGLGRLRLRSGQSLHGDERSWRMNILPSNPPALTPGAPA
jgi:hypothetical protein